MPKKPGAYYRPENMDEALHYLSQPDSAPLAGGTELLAQEEGVALAAVVDLQALGLDQIEMEGSCLKVGATVTLDNLDRYLERELGADAATALLRKAVGQAGPNTYRNAATLGGVCASRLADSELLAALLVMSANVIYWSPVISEMSLVDYLQAEEPIKGLITEISIPWSVGHGVSERVARTPKDYPIVSVSAWRPEGGSVRLAATGLGLRPKRLTTAESLLQAGINEQSVEQAAAVGANEHPGDFRGDANYRAQMAVVLIRRVLTEL